MVTITKKSALSGLAAVFALVAVTGTTSAQQQSTTTPFPYTSLINRDLSNIQDRFEQIERESRLNLTPSDDGSFMERQRTITPAQERAFQQISSLLNQTGERLDLMRDQIAASMIIDYPDKSAEDVQQMARDWVRDYMLQQISDNQDSDTKLTMPAQFQRSVRGCTQDGQIYQLSYNIAVDLAALGAFGNDDMDEEEASLLENHVHDTTSHFSGIAGMNKYLETLNEINETMNYTMQRLSGGLIDSMSSGEINEDTYNALLATIITQIENGIAQNYYNVDIDIIAEPALKLPGQCGAAYN